MDFSIAVCFPHIDFIRALRNRFYSPIEYFLFAVCFSLYVYLRLFENQ